jgi:hypothetical protein
MEQEKSKIIKVAIAVRKSGMLDRFLACIPLEEKNVFKIEAGLFFDAPQSREATAQFLGLSANKVEEIEDSILQRYAEFCKRNKLRGKSNSRMIDDAIAKIKV